ncbi:transcription factor IIIA-like [Hydractinia symbiolongicarpus]|uniref:transcription factor IIIA-like n=1 Tax=Hydractinia symbiolongicarpus TaxID=13093 RepID=UPI00254DC1B2|nr:transcription factor IIIA-like [Hydractinia symbiolongicarpus]
MLTKMAEQTPNGKTSPKFAKRTFPCPYDDCNSVFKKRAHLIRHELIHSDERPYKCTFSNCEKAFRSPCHLKRHESTHDKEKIFKCDFEGCQVSCITEWNLKRHIKRTHCGSFVCDKCGEEFKKNKSLQQHISLEHKSAAICCEFPGCSQIFNVAAKMRHHMKVHTGKGYVCPVKDCSLTFKLWSECLQHAAQCKKKEKKCDVCEKTFTEHSNLKAHMKIHSEEREVFQCNYDGCGRFYTKQYNLKIHVQSFHQNIRPFVCPKSNCNKSFHFQHLLRKHLDLHAKNHDRLEKKPSKRKRARRIVTSTISGISGYIPELWEKMTPEEVQAYIKNNNACYADTDVIPRDTETTQAEMTPLLSSDTEGASKENATGQTSHYQDDEARNLRAEGNDMECERLYTSEETLTAIPTESELTDEDFSVVYQPLKSLEEACSYLNQINNIKKQQNACSPIISSSPNSSRPASACSIEDERRITRFVGERLKQLVGQQNPNMMESCHMQSVTESDSSDSETKKKAQLLMQHCAS